MFYPVIFHAECPMLFRLLLLVSSCFMFFCRRFDGRMLSFIDVLGTIFFLHQYHVSFTLIESTVDGWVWDFLNQYFDVKLHELASQTKSLGFLFLFLPQNRRSFFFLYSRKMADLELLEIISVINLR